MCVVWKVRVWIAIAVSMVMMVFPYNCIEMNYIVGKSQQCGVRGANDEIELPVAQRFESLRDGE